VTLIGEGVRGSRFELMHGIAIPKTLVRRGSQVAHFSSTRLFLRLILKHEGYAKFFTDSPQRPIMEQPTPCFLLTAPRLQLSHSQ
jgi:hypothetical protein